MPKHVQLKDKDGNVYPNPYFPVGAIYMSMNNTNPSTYFGGTWSLIAPGRVLVGVDTSQAEFNTVNKTGGSKYLQKHTHNIVAKFAIADTFASFGLVRWLFNKGNENYGDGYAISSETGTGDSGNLQPYLTCYIWTRTA
jgi:hypothetical protein